MEWRPILKGTDRDRAVEAVAAISDDLRIVLDQGGLVEDCDLGLGSGEAD